MRKFSFIGRLMAFRTELVTLWRAFLHPATPMHLKALMLLVPLYLVSPVDLLPDVIPFAGWLDDAIIVPMLVSWIVSMLPRRAEANASRYRARPEDGKVIDGTARRR